MNPTNINKGVILEYEVQRAIKKKKECFKCLHLDKSAANIEDYKLTKRAAKRAVSATRHEGRGEGHL